MAAGDVTPTGLGARDTLRLEMGMALYGNDIDDRSRRSRPTSAGSSLKKGEFVGSARRAEGQGVKKKLVGFTLPDRNIARHGYPVFAGVRPAAWYAAAPEPDAGHPDRNGLRPDRRAKEGERSTSRSAEASPGDGRQTPFYKEASHL